MRRWLPRPGVSAILFVVWLLLNVSLHPSHLVLGAVLAVLIPAWLQPMADCSPGLGKYSVLARLSVTVLCDIVRANLIVARLILGPERRIRSRFVWVPLSIRNETGIATLAGVVTLTPGTVTVDLAPGSTHLLVHAFDVDDEAALIAEIKRRYEAPLMELFP